MQIRFSSLLFVVITLSAVAGCRAQPAIPTATPQAAASSASGVDNPPNTPDMVDRIDFAGKNIEVAFWHNRPQKDQDLLASMLVDFNKTNPYGIKARAEIAGVTLNDEYNRLNAAIQAGLPPEMALIDQNQAAAYRAQNGIIDLVPFIKSGKYGLNPTDSKDYIQPLLASDASPQFKGEQLGFPTQLSMQVMYYNVDWLKQLGYNEPPKDWKTWEETVCKASDPSKDKYGWAFRHDASDYASIVFGHGGRILAPDASAYVFNSDAGVESIALIQRLFKNKCAVEIPASEHNGEQSRFGSGSILFVFSSSLDLPAYQDNVSKGAKFNWSIATLPYVDKAVVDLFGESISIFKTTPEKELAAWLVLKFLGEKAQTTRWAAQTGFLPLRASAQADVVAALKTNPAWGSAADAYSKIFDWFPYTTVEAPVAGYDAVRTLIDKGMLTKVITDFIVDPKKLADQVVDQSNQVLKENTTGQ